MVRPCPTPARGSGSVTFKAPTSELVAAGKLSGRVVRMAACGIRGIETSTVQDHKATHEVS